MGIPSESCPLWSQEIVICGQYVELEELVPVATQGDGISEVGVFGDDGEVEPAAAVESLLATVVVHVTTANPDLDSLLGECVLTRSVTKVYKAILFRLGRPLL